MKLGPELSADQRLHQRNTFYKLVKQVEESNL